IATQVGGLPELVKDGYNGYLVQLNLDSVVKAIRRLAKSPELVKTMGTNSYTSAQENFTLETAILKYKNLINQIIENS
ncbi:MAG: glycosyltransferase, partial [Parabacteroides sp.]|nr:glycosyltransferase [Parabacteroides sp.]